MWNDAFAKREGMNALPNIAIMFIRMNLLIRLCLHTTNKKQENQIRPRSGHNNSGF
jgi:hypothetical protein